MFMLFKILMIARNTKFYSLKETRYTLRSNFQKFFKNHIMKQLRKSLSKNKKWVPNMNCLPKKFQS